MRQGEGVGEQLRDELGVEWRVHEGTLQSLEERSSQRNGVYRVLLYGRELFIVGVVDLIVQSVRREDSFNTNLFCRRDGAGDIELVIVDMEGLRVVGDQGCTQWRLLMNLKE